MKSTTQHNEWLSLIEISGPFLAVPVLKEAFPQGLEELDGFKRKRLRQAYEEYREALETDDPQFPELHAAWIHEVLSRGLELDEDEQEDVLKHADWCSTNLKVDLPEFGIALAPNLAVINEERADKPLMLIHTYEQGIDLYATLKIEGWIATPAERMVQLCRATGCRLGLVTNGEHWMLVDAPVAAITTFASWYARIWGQEPVTLQAFVHLLGIRRFFVDASEQLPALFDRSLKYQDEVTDILGEQVRRAVEVLIQALDKADQDRDRELLHDVRESALYEAALTVMIRLVFLLSAEERGLLLLGDERYEANYAISTLRMQLRKESEDILERRWDAWSRLLAIFRAVFGGIEHENLRLPALGGSLFDPDRFPFLEGRAKDSDWHTDTARPLPIDNRTVLLLLEAIQQFQGRTLSYRALDVEQIGYVYEGLLERTVKRTAEVTLELDATKSAKSPWVTLAELESAKLDGSDRLTELLRECSGSSAGRVRNDLAKSIDEALADRLLAACHGDTALRDRIGPYAHLVRINPWGYPLVYPAGAFIVTTGSDRRETGTHYTPKSLTEAIVTETLTPIAYVGPAEGTPREQWGLKSPAELLDLKICDPAMGSGAFLVQACRWLAERLVEAWSQAEVSGKAVSVDGEVLETANDKEPLSRDTEVRTVIARRLIAERCLYGVDLNPLAVELAKLSIWLVTLAKGRPFGFLDHNLRCGDSLLGVHRLDQLTELTMTPTGKGQQHLFGQNTERAVHEVIELRQRLREMPIRDIHDVEAMAQLDADSRRKLEVTERIADAFIGEVFASGGNDAAMENKLQSLTIQAGQAINGDHDVLDLMCRRAVAALLTDVPADKPVRRLCHWPLEFPEVFARERSGFDGIIGNPPFLGGQRITGVAGTAFRDWLVVHIAEGRRGSADLVVYFFLRAWSLLREGGSFGLLAVNTIAEGDTRQVGLEVMVGAGAVIHAAYPNEPWPGKAAVVTSRVHVYKGEWRGERSLLGRPASFISAFLSDREEWSLKRLGANKNLAYQGSNVVGVGFLLSESRALEMIESDDCCQEVIFPYIGGEDLNTHPEQKPSRWIINFWDWTEEKAKQYNEPYETTLVQVKPQRESSGDKSASGQRRREKWWLYGADGKELYHAMGRGSSFNRHPDGWEAARKEPLNRIIAIARVSKTAAFSFLSGNYVYSAQLVVFPTDDAAILAILQSNVHLAFAWAMSSKMKSDLRYSTTDCVESFPFLLGNPLGDLRIIGESYSKRRGSIMREAGIGLTKLYNRFHTNTERDPHIEELRMLQREMDTAVARTYGWDDLDLDHGFHQVPYLPENDRVRFTTSESARIEVLRRLSELNRQRYEEEVAQGLYGSTATRSRMHKTRAAHTENTPSRQPSFDFDAAPANEGAYPEAAEQCAYYQSGPTNAIVEHLKGHTGWHSKSDILGATGITNNQWSASVAELIADGRIERQGEKRGARYRVVTMGVKE